MVAGLHIIKACTVNLQILNEEKDQRTQGKGCTDEFVTKYTIYSAIILPDLEVAIYLSTSEDCSSSFVKLLE